MNVVGDAPLRVLYVARAPFVSGAERALRSMLRFVDRQRIEPRLVVGHHSGLIADARALDIETIITPMPKRSRWHPLAWRRSVAAMRNVIERFRPDVLHANDVPSCQALSVLGNSLGIARVVHVRWGITAPEAAWWARCGAERVICISRWVRDQLGDTADTALAGAIVDVLPDSVDWPALDSAPPPRTDRADDAPITLGFAGQLIESKGLDLVIEAMGRVDEAQRPRLLVAGKDTQTDGAYETHLRDLASRLGVAARIDWLGFLDDVADLHRQVDAMVCPSRLEPLGLVPLEAARFALPTFANRVGGLAETILDGRTGVLIDPTPDAWAAALRQLADRAALRALGRTAHDHTRAHYSPMVYQQRLTEIYRACRTPSAAGRGPG